MVFLQPKRQRQQQWRRKAESDFKSQFRRKPLLRNPPLKRAMRNSFNGIEFLTMPMKGKDDSSKAKMNVHLQLSDSEDSAEENVQMPSKVGVKSKGSSGTPTSTGDWGKGGKGDKTGKAASKSGTTREPIVKVVAEAELKIEEDLPKNAKCLMDSEAALILQGVNKSLETLSADPSFKIPEPFFKGLEYAKTGSHYKSPQSAREALLYPLVVPLNHDLIYKNVALVSQIVHLLFSWKNHWALSLNLISRALKANKATVGEICMIGNICPEMVDEVYAFVPSLKIVVDCRACLCDLAYYMIMLFGDGILVGVVEHPVSSSVSPGMAEHGSK
ncbi:hypothetical protein ACLOJK_041661 [Asimina triloba]